ncbi:glycoside hydrolase family 18 protein [Athelia psychrophila]|uniref:Glycoside hydrolase family 18 protein n=1 Tax=Athelia psychrophila TaxID=1759441 RepID=A0A166S9C3_9AGAM|nr:glycoside hydrolase family 18 protein [Fibularhizoctonia sp. CBS 109695]
MSGDKPCWELMIIGSSAIYISLIPSYHAAGISTIVSAFGSTETLPSSGIDSTLSAQKLAAWVKEYDLDGVGVDLEDLATFNGRTGSAENWLRGTAFPASGNGGGTTTTPPPSSTSTTTTTTTSSNPSSGPGSCSGVAAWSSSVAYIGGSLVTYN